MRRVGLLLGVALAACGGANQPPISARAVEVWILAEDRSWRADYLLVGGDGQSMKVATGREIHIPVGASVRLQLSATEFISDFSVGDLQLRDIATPRLPIDEYFVADRPGRYEVRFSELCGLPHAGRDRGWIVVEDPSAYVTWVHGRIRRGG